jgi:hypothetical protein
MGSRTSPKSYDFPFVVGLDGTFADHAVAEVPVLAR